MVGEKDKLFYQLDPTSATNVSPTNQLYNKDYNNFAPRLAFAYDVTGKGKTVIRAGWGIFYDAFAQDIFMGHAPFNCAFCPGPAFTGEGPAAIGSAGLAGGAISSTTPVFAGFSGLSDFFRSRPKIRTPYTQNFDLNVQQQLGNSRVRRLATLERKEPNCSASAILTSPARPRSQLRPSLSAPGHVPERPIGGFDGPDGVNFNVPRTAFPRSVLRQSGRIYRKFDLQRVANQPADEQLARFTAGVNFAWSHSIDDASDSEDFIPNAAQPNNSLITALERGNSNFDIRRRFSWNFGYEFPKMGGSWARLKNGWGVDGVLNLQDGQPFQLNYNFEGDYSGSARALIVPMWSARSAMAAAPSSVDLSSFQVPCTFGNTTGLGEWAIVTVLPAPATSATWDATHCAHPAFKEFNFSVFKNTAITERVNLQLTSRVLQPA